VPSDSEALKSLSPVDRLESVWDALIKSRVSLYKTAYKVTTYLLSALNDVKGAHGHVGKTA
jgi:hypothetical protein